MDRLYVVSLRNLTNNKMKAIIKKGRVRGVQHTLSLSYIVYLSSEMNTTVAHLSSEMVMTIAYLFLFVCARKL